MNESSQETNALVHQLRQMPPKRVTIDVRETFYQAGYEACRVKMRASGTRQLSLAIAVALAALVITGPSGYLIGRLVNQESPSELSANAELGEIVPEPRLREMSPENHEQSPQPSSTLPRSDQADLRHLVALEPDDGDEGLDSSSTARLASWINPLASIATSTKLDRQSESILTATHASLFLLNGSRRDLSEFPFSGTAVRQLSMSGASVPSGSDDKDSHPTLAAGDFRAVAIGLEATQ